MLTYMKSEFHIDIYGLTNKYRDDDFYMLAIIIYRNVVQYLKRIIIYILVLLCILYLRQCRC